ncbi:MAG: DUF5615 family PIN-like protein [Bacteroidota bacterium]
MKLLFDQNISPRILKIISPELPESQHVRFVGLVDSSDIEIFRFAKTKGYSIVTFDSDFVDLNALYGTPPKIIWLNTGNLTTRNISDLVVRNIRTIKQYLEAETDEIMELIKVP